MLVFDIETGPLDEETVLSLAKPFVEPEPPGEFDPESVKLGNLRDPAKRQAKIEEKQAEHQALVDNHSATVEGARAAWASENMDRAALSPITGRVLAIGYASKEKAIIHGDDQEDVLLGRFWDKVEECCRVDRSLVGHNIFGFDLPFLIRRSWIHSIDVPDWLINGRGLQKGPPFVDTMTVWTCGQYGEFIQLDQLARTFGVNGKPSNVSGADFARLWHGTPEEHQQARDYLLHDLEMTRQVAMWMAIV